MHEFERFVASSGDGIEVAAHDAGGWNVERTSGERALALGACGERIFAGTGRGVLRSDDRGRTWRASGLDGVRVTGIGCGGDIVYAGTKGPLLFSSEDGGETWSEIELFRGTRRWYWWTPVSRPHREAEASAIVVSRADPATFLVGIEAGAVIRTTDGGRTWEGHGRGAVRDCHTLSLHPTAPGYVYEGGGTGSAFSRDDGRTWIRTNRGLGRRRYGWAAAGSASDPETRFLSAARGPKTAHGALSHAWIFRATRNEPWRPVAEFDAMPYALVPSGPGLLAGLSDGRVLVSDDEGSSWAPVVRFSSIFRVLLAV